MTGQSIAAATWLSVRSMAAVIAGLAVIIMLSTGTDALLRTGGIIPSGPIRNPWHSLLALTYRSLFTIAGGFVTAWLAPRARMRHAVILAVIGTMAGVMGVIATLGLNYGPNWYPIALAVSIFPAAWFGGWLHQHWYARP